MEKTAKTEERTLAVRAKAYIKPIVLGLLAGAGAILLLLVLFAAAIPAVGLDQAAAPWLARIASVAGGFAAGFFAARCRKKRGLLIGGMTGLLLGGCVLVAGLLFPGESLLMQAITKLLLYAVAGMLGGVLGVGSGGKRRR